MIPKANGNVFCASQEQRQLDAPALGLERSSPVTPVLRQRLLCVNAVKWPLDPIAGGAIKQLELAASGGVGLAVGGVVQDRVGLVAVLRGNHV